MDRTTIAVRIRLTSLDADIKRLLSIYTPKALLNMAYRHYIGKGGTIPIPESSTEIIERGWFCVTITAKDAYYHLFADPHARKATIIKRLLRHAVNVCDISFLTSQEAPKETSLKKPPHHPKESSAETILRETQKEASDKDTWKNGSQETSERNALQNNSQEASERSTLKDCSQEVPKRNALQNDSQEVSERSTLKDCSQKVPERSFSNNEAQDASKENFLQEPRLEQEEASSESSSDVSFKVKKHSRRHKKKSKEHSQEDSLSVSLEEVPKRSILAEEDPWGAV